MEQVRYQYENMYDTEEEAKAVAGYFHEVLRGNQDYVNNRVLLHWSRGHVLLCEFTDSNTHIHVSDDETFTDQSGNVIPVLELLAG